MKIQLVNAPLTNNIIPSTRSGVFPPVNLIALSSYIKCHSSDIEIEILDGDILSEEDIENKLGADIIGIGCTIISYKQAIKIAKVAKSKKAIVVLGGQHVSSIWHHVLNNHQEIDYVIRGDGEEALLALAKGDDITMISNLCYKKDNAIISNSIKDFDINDSAILDYSDMPIELYNKKFTNQGIFSSYSKCAGIYIQKGCSWQHVGGGCIFCRKSLTKYQRKEPAYVWKEIIRLNKEYNIDFFHDVSDEFTADFNWLKVFAENKPNQISPGLFIFSRADQIKPETVKILKKINCVEVLIGVETGDVDLLKCTHKPVTLEDSINAVKMLSDADIKVYPTFLFGLPGETLKTIENTMKFAEQLVSFGNIDELSCSILLPIPSSPSFNMICTLPGFDKKFNTDLLDPDELRNIWVEHFCKVGMNDLYEAIKNVSSIAPRINQFGMKFDNQESIIINR